MEISAGSRLGPYEIVALLGAGGMGEVYRARDTRLDREVAVKVLPRKLSANPDFRMRFEREAKTISSLSHPNICSLFDVGSQDGTDYLVMELLEGETLADRLKRGALPLDQMRRVGMEIAEALDRAHRQGIVHRDLKPGNVMLTRSGAKLMDFGLAKPGTARDETSGLTATRTHATPLTAQGTIVGTFQYMSPEQVEGKEADARSDLFALGAVLYEMATGTRAFEGKTQISVMAAVLEKDPVPMSEILPVTPPALERLVRVCLEKDPERRLQSARDVRLHLEWLADAETRQPLPSPTPAPRPARRALAWIVAVVCLAVAAASSAAYLRARSVHPRSVRSYVLPPDKTEFAFDAPTGGAVLSPDGTRVVFAATDAAGKKLLWIRPLDSLSAQPLEETGDASFPFWSPDGRFVAYFVPGKLKKIDTQGGPPQTVCAAPNGRGGTWSPNGTIVFTPDVFGGIHKVPSAGGASSEIVGLDKAREQTSLRWPFFLPGGEHFLYWGGSPTAPSQESNGIYVGSLDGRATRFLFGAESNALYARPGYLLFLRDRSLMAQPFDARALETRGEAVPVAEDVANRLSYRLGCFSVSDDGSLAYQTGANVRVRPTWLAADGAESGTAGAFADVIALRISPDGRRLAEQIQDPRNRSIDVWLMDLDRGVRSRFTFDPVPHFLPAWSPDGGSVVYSAMREGHFDLFVKNASGAGEASLLLTSDANKYVTDWSRDGRYLLFNQVDSRSKTLADVFVLPMSGERKPRAFLRTDFNESNAACSPDGRWVAYQSNESGRTEVYVTTFPEPGGKWQVSQEGGQVPRWSPDGSRLYYRGLVGGLMEAPVKVHGASVEIGSPRPFANVRFADTGGTALAFDVSPAGGRLLYLKPEQVASVPLVLVTHWTEGLRR